MRGRFSRRMSSANWRRSSLPTLSATLQKPGRCALRHQFRTVRSDSPVLVALVKIYIFEVVNAQEETEADYNLPQNPCWYMACQISTAVTSDQGSSHHRNCSRP